jgi:hypothetical protein
MLLTFGKKDKRLVRVAGICASAKNFNYLTTKCRTNQTVDAMIRSEQNLRMRWDDTDRIRNNITHGLDSLVSKDVLSKLR